MWFLFYLSGWVIAIIGVALYLIKFCETAEDEEREFISEAYRYARIRLMEAMIKYSSLLGLISSSRDLELTFFLATVEACKNLNMPI